MPRKAIIIGAGPAGLTAAYKLLKRTDIVPIILEKDDIVGGISRTINYKGNRIDRVTRHFFDSTRDIKNFPWQMLAASTMYMWDLRSPLWMYMSVKFKTNPTASSLQKWAFMSPLYTKYGTYLTLKYYVNKVRTAFKDYRVRAIDFLSPLTGAMNVLFLLGLIFVFTPKRLRRSALYRKTLLLAGVFWIVNFSFSVLASPITLRYQLFAILVVTYFAILMTDNLVQSAVSRNGI